MKKIFVMFIVITLLFSACDSETPTEINYVYQLTIEATEIYNDHIGTDWKKTYTCDGKVITSGELFDVPTNTTKTINIEATITEIDKWSDEGLLPLRLF